MKEFTLVEASREFNISRPTLLKRLTSGEIAAKKDENGWKIPLDELLSAGILQRKIVKNADQSSEKSDVNSPVKSEKDHLIDSLRIQLTLTQKLADDREKTIDYLQLSLRALTASPSEVQPVQLVSEKISEPKKSWWKKQKK